MQNLPPNFYQSRLWRDIQELYGNETFDCTIGDQPYRWLIKKKPLWPRSASWLQILWVEREPNLISDPSPAENGTTKSVKKYEIQRQSPSLKDLGTRQGWRNLGWGSPFFLQLGITTPLTTIDQPRTLRPDQIDAIVKTRQQATTMITDQGLRPTIRENMPASTITLDATKTDTDLMDRMSSQAVRFIKKTEKKWITYSLCTSPIELDTFYSERTTVAGGKWFNTITKAQFDKLVTYLQTNKCWSVMVSKLDSRILSGGIFLEHASEMIYLYGFSSRDPDVRNIGAHHGLMRHMLQTARKKWLMTLDLRGWSPTWEPNHHLAPVSTFKESLGWSKIEYYGSFDIILRPRLYKLFTWRQSMR